MSIELTDGVVVRVVPPDLPAVRAAPPTPPTVTVLPVPGPQGPPGPAGGGSDVGQVRITVTAAQDLSGHRAVTRNPDGLLEYADNATPSHVHAPVWITQGAVMADADAEVIVYGALAEPSWSWIPGGSLYLGTGGVITQSPPVSPAALFSARIGVATGTTEAFFDRQPSIVLT